MYTTLLWATDGSEGAETALQEALALLEPGGKLIAFHCDQRLVGGRASGVPVFVDEVDRRALLRQRIAELAANGIDAELVVETTHHSTASAIVHAADELHVDAIVCGTRGLGAVRGALLGSVSKELLHHARVPVVVVPPKAAVTAS